MKAVILILVLFAVWAAPVRAQSLEARLDDARVVAQAKVALAQDEVLRAFTFQPTVSGGALTLTGVVQTQAQKDRAAEVVRGLEGVREVVDNVRVAGAAGPDLSDLPPPPEADPAEAGTSEDETAPEPEPEPTEVYHTVQRGNTLGAIARRYGVSVRQIQQLNGLRGTNIRIGQRLRVK